MSQPLPRLPLVDAARGAALAAMAVYHFIWDLAFFGIVARETTQAPVFQAFGHGVAISFLMLVGVSLALSARDGLKLAAFWRRLAIVFAAAMLVTLVTTWIFPESFVGFGVLHCILAASLLGLVFLGRAWPFAALAGIAIILAPWLIAGAHFEPIQYWSGLGSIEPRSNDWRPLFPWAGFTLLGLAGAQAFLARGLPERMTGWRESGAISRTLTLGGRHSLAFYLVHQPVLFALVFIASQITGPAPADRDQPMFHASCVGQCVKAGAGREFCESACTCVVSEANKAGLWDKMTAGRMNEADRARYDGLTQQCLRASPPKAP